MDLDVLGGLMDHGLLRLDARDRFTMLVSVREYAAEHLDAGARAEAEARHGAWFAQLGSEDALRALDLHGGPPRMAALAAERVELAAAVERAVARGDGPVAHASGLALAQAHSIQGPIADVMDLLAAAASLEGPRRRFVLVRLGVLLGGVGRATESRARLLEALALHEVAGDRLGAAVARACLGFELVQLGRVAEAREVLTAALAEIRGEGDPLALVLALGHAAAAEIEGGNVAQAQALLEENLALASSVGYLRAEASQLTNLATLWLDRGDLARAEALYLRALAVHREIGNRWTEALVLGNLGNLLTIAGRPVEARARFEAALALHRRLGDRRFEGVVLGNLGVLESDLGRATEARGLLELAIAVDREVGNRRSEALALGALGTLRSELGEHDGARDDLERAVAMVRDLGNARAEGPLLVQLAAARIRAGDPDARAALDAGERMVRESGNLTMLAVALCGRVELEVAARDPTAARRALAEALALTIDTPPETRVGRARDRARALAAP